MTQKERIIDYLETHGSITPMEAFSELGITKLATKISEMIHQDGMDNINKEYVSGKNRYGEKCHFMRYSIKEQ